MAKARMPEPSEPTFKGSSPEKRNRCASFFTLFPHRVGGHDGSSKVVPRHPLDLLDAVAADPRAPCLRRAARPTVVDTSPRPPRLDRGHPSAPHLSDPRPRRTSVGRAPDPRPRPASTLDACAAPRLPGHREARVGHRGDRGWPSRLHSRDGKSSSSQLPRCRVGGRPIRRAEGQDLGRRCAAVAIPAGGRLAEGGSTRSSRRDPSSDRAVLLARAGRRWDWVSAEGTRRGARGALFRRRRLHVWQSDGREPLLRARKRDWTSNHG